MHGNAKKWREKMGEIIFGVIGIGIISAAKHSIYPKNVDKKNSLFVRII